MLGESDIAGGRVSVDGETEDLVDARRVGDSVTFAQSRQKGRNQMLLVTINKYA